MTLDRVALVRAQGDVDEGLPSQQLVEDGRQVALVVVPSKTVLLPLLLLMMLMVVVLLLLLVVLMLLSHLL